MSLRSALGSTTADAIAIASFSGICSVMPSYISTPRCSLRAAALTAWPLATVGMRSDLPFPIGNCSWSL